MAVGCETAVPPNSTGKWETQSWESWMIVAH